ncbi:MAG TPA: MBOAT family O-acyltransferase [Candidatus Obscuribacterales bacterium]
MLFNSLTYALFLPIVVALYWFSPPRLRVPILIIASYIFYMSWRPAFIILILGLTIANYFLGFAIHNSRKHKKAWLASAVAANLATLAFFKYAYFCEDVLGQLVKPFGITQPHIPFDIVLPLGISFFVFEFIHYVVDVYRGSEPIKSFLAFSLFASFFPTQIAGPIKRFQDFIPQFLTPAKFSVSQFDEGISLILLGLFKKVLLADNLSFFVQGGFTHPELFHGIDLWIFTYAFAFQIYFDFSGYTDIARGSAMLFGYKVPINFNLPYLASNIADFWHRWHISLSTWLRDYLFIPLGGSRGSRWQIYRNLMITMSLGGLWHGASMHFLVWGVFHGAMLSLHRMCKEMKEASAKTSAAWAAKAIDSLPGRCLATLLTFHIVCIGWVLFRAETLTIAWEILKKMFFLDAIISGAPPWQMALPAINYPLIYPSIFLLLPLLAIAHVVMGWINQTSLVQRSPKLVKAAWCCAMMFLIIVFSPDKSPRFIYFQF